MCSFVCYHRLYVITATVQKMFPFYLEYARSLVYVGLGPCIGPISKLFVNVIKYYYTIC